MSDSTSDTSADSTSDTPADSSMGSSLSHSSAISAICRQLFEPSAAYLGLKIRDQLQKWFDEGNRERHACNTFTNFEAVVNERPPGSCGTIPAKSFPLLFKWAEGVREVSAEEPERAGMWRGILHKILDGEGVSECLLDIMKKIDLQMAELLLSNKPMSLRDGVLVHSKRKSKVTVGWEDIGAAQRLEELGLLVRSYNHVIVNFSIFITGATALWVGGLGLSKSSFLPRGLSDSVNIIVISLLLIAGAMLFAANYSNRIYIVSSTGEQIIEASRKTSIHKKTTKNATQPQSPVDSDQGPAGTHGDF